MLHSSLFLSRCLSFDCVCWKSTSKNDRGACLADSFAAECMQTAQSRNMHPICHRTCFESMASTQCPCVADTSSKHKHKGAGFSCYRHYCCNASAHVMVSPLSSFLRSRNTLLLVHGGCITVLLLKPAPTSNHSSLTECESMHCNLQCQLDMYMLCGHA